MLAMLWQSVALPVHMLVDHTPGASVAGATGERLAPTGEPAHDPATCVICQLSHQTHMTIVAPIAAVVAFVPPQIVAAPVSPCVTTESRSSVQSRAPPVMS